jgi:hypothetical protein
MLGACLSQASPGAASIDLFAPIWSILGGRSIATSQMVGPRDAFHDRVVRKSLLFLVNPVKPQNQKYFALPEF